MDFQFYFKKMESSEALKSLSQRKLSDVIERFLGDSGHVHITFSTERSEQKIHCHFHTWNGAILNASGASESMYASIDLVTQKLEAQLARHKMKTRRRSRLPFAQNRALRLVGANDFYSEQDTNDEGLEEFETADLQVMH